MPVALSRLLPEEVPPVPWGRLVVVVVVVVIGDDSVR